MPRPQPRRDTPRTYRPAPPPGPHMPKIFRFTDFAMI